MENLSDTFLMLCHDAAKRLDAFNTEQSNHKNMYSFSMYFRMIRVELIYSRKWELIAPPSVLYARFYLNKNLPIYLHLPELIAYLEKEDYRACYFPYIESEQRMQDCFAALLKILEDYIPLAEQASIHGEGHAIMERWAQEGFFDEPEKQKTDTQEKIDWDTMAFVRKLQESTMVVRHTVLGGYDAFLTGDRAKAIKEYKKLEKKGISLYERGLLAFLQSEKSENFVPMPLKCYCAKQYRKQERGDLTDLKGVALFYGLHAVVFCALIAVLNGFLSAGTLYFYGVPWWFGCMLAVITTIFGYIACQNFLRRKLGGDTAFGNVGKSIKNTRRVAAVVYALVMVACLVFCAAVPPMSSRYYDTYMIFYSEEEKVQRFEYAEVREICYISARYNEYGDRLERASYVLIFGDGRQVDLDCDGNAEKQREMIDRLLPSVPIRQLDSDRDLPNSK